MPLLHVINFYLLSVLIYFFAPIAVRCFRSSFLCPLFLQLDKLAGGTKFYRKLPPKVWSYVANKD